MATSVADIVAQNTAGKSEGVPVGVPSNYDWYNGLYKPAGFSAAPAGFTSVTAWGQVYQESGAPAYTSQKAAVEVANARTYVHIRATGEWVLVQNQATTGISGGHFVNDFSGNSAMNMGVTNSSTGASFAAPPSGYNDHFWPTSRGVFAAGAVDGVYVQMDMRVNDPNLNLIANVGADWWRSPTAPYVNGFSNNPGAGMSNWVELSTQWTTLGFYSMTTSQFQANLPPTLVGAPQNPPAGAPDVTAPLAPTITAFTPDTGVVGDKITTESVLTITGAAEAGSTVRLFDGTAQIGSTKATASGSWSLTTADLAVGTHNFSANATDASGNISTASSLFSVKVDAQPLPLASGINLLVNGSFEQTAVGTNKWASFSSVPGWTALNGSMIELWNNLNNVRATDGQNYGELDFLSGRDGFYQDVRTTPGQSYDLSFDARSRPGLTSSTTSMEVLWNDKLVATVPPGNAWQEYHFTVTGTGGQDRLTFREVAGQHSDGLGALYDNVSLVAIGSNSSQQSALAEQSRAIDLMTQYSAASPSVTSVATMGGLAQNDMSNSLAQTLTIRVH